MADFNASGVGEASAEGVLARQGVGAAEGAAASLAAGVLARQGAGAAEGVAGGTAVALVRGGAAGAGAGLGVGVTARKTDVQISGTGEAFAVGVSAGIFVSDGSSTAEASLSSGDGFAAGSSFAASALSAISFSVAGVATAGAVSSLRAAGRGASPGAGSATGVGGVSWESRSAETDTATAIHALTFVQTASATATVVPIHVVTDVSSAVASETTDLLEIRRSVGRAAGTSVAKSYTLLVETLVSTGEAENSLFAGWRSTDVSSGVASNTIAVTQRRYVVGRSDAISSAAAHGIGGTEGVGEASGTSSALWVGRGVTVTTAASAGTSSVLASVTGLASAVAHSAGASSTAYTSKGRQLEILVSSAEVEDAMQFPLPAVYPVFWSNTIGASGATWEGLPFNSMVEVDGVIYAASASGLYRLDDTADDDGADVLANIEWDLADRSDYKQRARSIYIHAIADGPFTVTVENKQGQFSYQTHLSNSTKMMNHRTPIGRGITSRAMRLGLQQNRYFSVADLNLESGDTTRRI